MYEWMYVNDAGDKIIVFHLLSLYTVLKLIELFFFFLFLINTRVHAIRHAGNWRTISNTYSSNKPYV